MRARFAVSGFVAGGVAAVESIEREHYDVLSVHCRPRKLDVATQLARKFTKATLQKSAA
jgi:hypothetical protein